MKLKSLFGPASTFALAATFAGCAGVKLQRVPPGQSISRHLDSANHSTVPLPPPTGPDMPVTATPGGAVSPGPTVSATVRPEALPPLPVAGLPERNDSIERAGDAYTRGSILMKNGQSREAIAAFEEATLLDPSFSDAWTRLTLLYEKAGQSDKAKEAFRRAKGLSARPERLTAPTEPPGEVIPPPATAIESPAPPTRPAEGAPLPPPTS